jgi:hypothetical protein
VKKGNTYTKSIRNFKKNIIKSKQLKIIKKKEKQKKTM